MMSINIKYFVARGKGGKIEFARAKEGNLPTIGMTVSSEDPHSERFSLSEGNWVITHQMPDGLSDFIWGLSTLDEANDIAHGDSQYETLAADLCNYILSL